MTISINTNIAALTAQKTLSKNQDHLAMTLNRLSSGRRINEAKDDAAGLAISENMTAQIRGLSQAAKNGNDAISLIQSAESGINETLSLLQRMRELATQASTGTYSSANLSNMDLEFQALKGEVDRVAQITTYNNISLLSGANANVSIQIGSNNTANDKLSITLVNTTSTTLGINSNILDSTANAQTALDNINTAINSVTAGLAQLGASHSNLQAAIDGNIERMTQIEASRSRIVDTDFAFESTKLAQFQIIQQSGAAMLAQANASGQIALKLIQG